MNNYWFLSTKWCQTSSLCLQRSVKVMNWSALIVSRDTERKRRVKVGHVNRKTRPAYIHTRQKCGRWTNHIEVMATKWRWFGHTISYRRAEIEGESRGRHRQADSRQSAGKLLRGAEREMPAGSERTVKCQLNTHIMKRTDRGREGGREERRRREAA